MSQFAQFVSRVVPLPIDDIDTDQIIPARFLKTTVRVGLGKFAFADWRLNADGSDKASFPLNMPEHKGASVLVAGRNFGCGSSREHAPWALVDCGFKAVVARSFADIFKGNALKNGLLPIAVDEDFHTKILALSATDNVTVDLESQKISLPSGESVSFDIDPFSKRCLIDGVDELGYLLSFADKIAAHEEARR